MKKVSVFFSLCLLTLSAFANGVEIGGINYVLNRSNLTASVTYRVWPKDGANPISATESLYTGDVVIPSTITYLDTVYRVTSIGDNAFFGSKRMTSVKIPNSVTSVGYMAFCYCSGLKALTFPETLTSIGAYMFTSDMGRVNIACMALVPPSVQYSDLGVSVTIHVPCEVIPKYQSALGWSRHSIKSILLESERLATNSVNLSWLPVENADNYRVGVEAFVAGQQLFSDTLIIAADPSQGGIMTTMSASAPIHRVVMDDVGSLVVIALDPSSGASAGEPFVMNVHTEEDYLISCRVYLMARQGEEILKQDQILFALNDAEAIESNTSKSLPTAIYDLHGHRYSMTEWSQLPQGVYILMTDTRTEKRFKP